MPKYTLERKQLIPGDVSTVFGFFENPHNLKDITPAWLSFRVKSSTDNVVRHGTRISYTIRWLGLPVRWESLIARYERGVVFADQMLRGPYKSWYHTHEFNEVPEGVEMTDRVVYEMPFGLLGRLAHALMVRRQLNAIFDHRAARIARLLHPAAGPSERQASSEGLEE
jgi:ligand-binding SRPBCC domain-containing protein